MRRSSGCRWVWSHLPDRRGVAPHDQRHGHPQQRCTPEVLISRRSTINRPEIALYSHRSTLNRQPCRDSLGQTFAVSRVSNPVCSSATRFARLQPVSRVYQRLTVPYCTVAKMSFQHLASPFLQVHHHGRAGLETLCFYFRPSSCAQLSAGATGGRG